MPDLTQDQPPPSLKDEVPLLTVQRAIFHFVPGHTKSATTDVVPTLMEEETPLDDQSRHLIQERLRAALTSNQAFDVEFNPNNGTPVKALVEGFLASPEDTFISISQNLATALFNVQNGNNSPGLLALIDCRLGDKRGAVIVKLKSEMGSRLFDDRDRGHRRYRMEVLRDLFLTEGTRVFKSALFVPGSMRILVCDDQRGSVRQYEVALFFLEEFLGCKRLEVGHVLTKRFYNAGVDFLNEKIQEADRNELYDDLVSQLRRRTQRMNVREFARDFVPTVFPGKKKSNCSSNRKTFFWGKTRGVLFSLAAQRRGKLRRSWRPTPPLLPRELIFPDSEPVQSTSDTSEQPRSVRPRLERGQTHGEPSTKSLR